MKTNQTTKKTTRKTTTKTSKTAPQKSTAKKSTANSTRKTAVKKGLGRGLEGLLGADVSFTQSLGDAKQDKAVMASGDSVKMMSVKSLQAGKYQPRRQMDESELRELADSIAAQGIIQPLLIRSIEEQAKGQYEIIAGERRFRAAQLAGLEEVPVVIRDVSDEQAAVFALIENMQRADLNPLEEARGVQRLIKEFEFTHEQAARAIGRSRSFTSNLLRLLNLAEPVQNMLLAEQLDMGHARALLALDTGSQIMAANKVINKKLSVRETERLIKQMQEGSRGSSSSNNKTSKDGDTLRLEKQLSDFLSTKVEIKMNKKNQGALVIDFHSLDQLDELLEKQGLSKILE